MASKSKAFRFRGAKAAPKTQERDLILKAKILADNPDLLIPKCEGKCFLCPFKGIKKRLYKVQKFRANKDKLEWFANWGNPYARAYAATLSLALSEKAPYLAVARYPFGEISYAVRGKTSKEKLISVQYFDDPKWRLLGLVEFAKKGLNLYSSKTGVICTGRSPKPPSSFVKEAIANLKYSLTEENGLYTCLHIHADAIKSAHSGKKYLVLEWLSGRVSIAICEICCGDRNSFFILNERSVVPNPDANFKIRVVSSLECQSRCDVCAVKIEEAQINLDKYLNGKLSDRDFFNQNKEYIIESLRNSNAILFAIGSNCYGIDTKRFVDSLKAAPEEQKALYAILDRINKPLLVEERSVNKALMPHWKTYGKLAINAILNDEALAEEIFNRTLSAGINPTQIIKEVGQIAYNLKITSSLPKYSKLPIVAKFADEVARSYKTEGTRTAVLVIEKCKESDTKIKSISFSFLYALSEYAGKEWRFTKEEIEFGKYLKEFAEKLLSSTPEEYTSALQNLLSASGCSEKIEDYII